MAVPTPGERELREARRATAKALRERDALAVRLERLRGVNEQLVEDRASALADCVRWRDLGIREKARADEAEGLLAALNRARSASVQERLGLVQRQQNQGVR